jgi:hypothetical protein
MFGQLLTNKNKIIHCYTVLHSNSANADSGELNTGQQRSAHFFFLQNPGPAQLLLGVLLRTRC